MIQDNPITRNYRSIIYFGVAWIAFAAVHATILLLCCGLAGWYVAMDAVVFNAVLAACVIALWYPLRYNKVEKRLTYSYYINNAALIVAMVVVWLAVSCFVIYAVVGEYEIYMSFLRESLLWRIPEGLFVVVLSVLSYNLYICIELNGQLRDAEQELRHQMVHRHDRISSVTIKDGKQIYVVPVEDIDYIEADGDYVKIHTGHRTFIKETTMKHFAENLPSGEFVRIHRSYIVNVSRIVKVELYEKESYRINLKDGTSLKAGATGYRLLRETMNF